MQSAGNKRETSLLSSAAPICSESAGGALFTQRCMRVCEEGGRKKGHGEKGIGEMEGQGWKREEGWAGGGDSW